MVEDVIARLQSEIEELNHRVQGAGDLSELMASNRLPQSEIGAFVIPLGLASRGAESMAGAHVQSLNEVIGVLLTLRASGREGKDVLSDLRGFVLRIINAIAGWVPNENAMGVFNFTRGQVISQRSGTFVYQLEFTISDQLRILS